ncbi:MAG TPA: phosphatidate cytidylyltransferase [Rhizomicrobium sp.]
MSQSNPRGANPRGAHPGQAARSTSEGVLRLLFGLFMAVVAIAVLFTSVTGFAVMTALLILLAAREWHRLVRSPAMREQAEHQPLHLQTVITAAAAALAIAAVLLHQVLAGFAVLALGAVAAFLVARRRGDNPFWHAGGVLYLGIPALAIVALRAIPPQGALIVLGLFLIVWATDTGALVFGKLIGGKRIAPRLSPGKTWAGTVGGSVTAALVFGLYIAFFGFNVPAAMLFAFVFSVTAHGGDLFESLVKRRFNAKDSGALIPGHGGVLDRMDSLFAAGTVLALLVFGLHLNPMFGGHA